MAHHISIFSVQQAFLAQFYLLCCDHYFRSFQISEANDSSQANTVQKTKRQIALHHTDIIGDSFWNDHPDILNSWSWVMYWKIGTRQKFTKLHLHQGCHLLKDLMSNLKRIAALWTTVLPQNGSSLCCVPHILWCMFWEFIGASRQVVHICSYNLCSALEGIFVEFESLWESKL